MNITQNTQSESKGNDLYWGLANMYIQSINPNNAELNALGLKTKDEEPDYLIVDTDTNKVKGCRFDVYLKSAEKDKNFFTKISYAVFNTEFFSERTSKYQFVNSEGKTAWAEDESNLIPSFRDTGKVRKALQGEGNLLEFMRCFFDIRAGQECYIPKENYVNNFFKGDFSSVKKLLTGYNETNKVKFIMGINSYTKDNGEVGYFQSAIANIPLRPYAKVNDYLLNQVTYYLNNTDDKYLIQVPEFPYDLTIWTPADISTGTGDMEALDNLGEDDIPF